MDQYVVSGLVMNRENLTNPVPVEPRAGAALTTTNAPATHRERRGRLRVSKLRIPHLSTQSLTANIPA